MNATPTPTPACGNCGVEERRLLLLHHVRHRGIFRRLCTSCVLRLHPQSFCPTCFHVYSPPLPPTTDAVVSCLKCDSFSHPHCANSSGGAPYTCPPCASPGVPIFDAARTELDRHGARVLLAAVRVAAGSMSKAAAGARVEAEKRAKEAAFARKRAREALEHVAFLVAREKVKRKELGVVASAEVSVVARERNYKAVNAPVMELNRVGNQRAVEGVDGPNEVSARLNAVGLREKERLQGFGGLSAVSGIQSNGAGMVVESNERPRASPASNMGGICAQTNVNERSDNLVHLANNNAQGEKVSNGLYSVLPVGDQLKHVQSNHGREEKMGSQQ